MMHEFDGVRAELTAIGRVLERMDRKLDTLDQRAEARHLEARTVEGRLSVVETTVRSHADQLAASRDHGPRLTKVETQAAIRPALAASAGLIGSVVAALLGMRT